MFESGLLRMSKTGIITCQHENKAHNRREQTKQRESGQFQRVTFSVLFIFFEDVHSIHILYQSENASVAVPFNRYSRNTCDYKTSFVLNLLRFNSRLTSCNHVREMNLDARFFQLLFRYCIGW